MHKCTDCGTEFEGKFCPDCGLKRENLILCPKCYAEVKAGARYCTECGLKQPEKTAEAVAGEEEAENAAGESAEAVAGETDEETAEAVAGEEEAENAAGESAEAVAGETDEETAEAVAGETDEETAEAVAGESDEKTAGEVAGETDVETAEEVAGETDEETAKEVAGETDEETAKEVAGETDEESMEAEVKEKGGRPSKFTVLRYALYYAPAALISLLSVILWAVFAAPAATYDGQSYGNIYGFAGDGEYIVSLNGCARALIAFAVIATLFSAFALCVRFILPLASKKIKISALTFRLSFAADCAAGVICLALFITGAVACGIARSPVSRAGASGALVLSFSLLFLILIVGALVADFVLKKYVPAYADAAAAHEAKIDADAERKAEKIAEQLALTRENAEEVARPEKESNKKLAAGLYFLEKGKAFLRMYCWAGVILSLALVLYNFHYDRTTDLMNNALLIIARVCVAAVVALALGMAAHMLLPARVPDKKRLSSLRTGYIIRIAVTVALMFAVLAYVIVCTQAVDGLTGAQTVGLEVLGITPAGVSLSLIFLCAVPFALSVAGAVTCGKLDKKYFSKLPEGGYENGFEPLEKRREARVNYAVYLYDTTRNAHRAAAGKAVKGAKQYKKERALLAAAGIAAVFVLAAAIFFAVIFAPHNIYKTGRIEGISVGDNMGYVYRTLGEPFDREEEKGKQIWAYCSDSLARTIVKKTEQLERLTAQMSWDNVSKIDKLQAEITALEAKLDNRRCNYVYVTFLSDTVSAVSFEKNCRRSEQEERQVKKITYACEPVQGNTYGGDVYKSSYYKYEEKPTVSRYSISQGSIYLNVRIYFTDGSLVNKTQMIAAQAKTGLQTLEWHDIYGDHTVYLSVR